MTTVEVCTLIQTAAVVVSGVVLYWYTRETQKIRLQGAEQLKLTQDLLKLEIDRDNSANQPIFQWLGRSVGGAQVTYEFKNLGAEIMNLQGEANPPIKCDITHNLNETQLGRVEFRADAGQAMPTRFKVHYTTKRRERLTKYFEIPVGASPQEIDRF